MIIPVVFSLTPVLDNIVLGWVFYKSIDIVKSYGWPVFAQKQYYDINVEQKKQELFSESSCRCFDYEAYQPEDKQRIIPEIFPQKIIDEYIARFPSQTDAYYASMLSAWPEMTDFMVERVKADEARLGEKTEAFLCHSDAPFIREAADKLGIKIIHFELGPFRWNTYRNTAYLDFVGTVCDGEMSARYQVFQAIAHEVPILTRREILAVFLNDENLHYASDEDPEPEFSGGLVLPFTVALGPLIRNQISALEMLTRVRSVLGNDSLQVRYHPGDFLNARIPGVQERSGSLIDFVQSSRRLFTDSSNVDYEAMLFNRPVYDFGDSQYGLFANHDMTGLPDRIASEEFLSFIAFGYLVPFEMLKSINYLRWRLSNPGEAEIYRYHLAYYLNCLQVPEEVLDMPSQERFAAILKHRGTALEEDIPLQDIPIWMKKDEVSRLNISLNRLERRYEHLKKQKEEEIRALLNSRSYRYTRPLRDALAVVRRFLGRTGG